MASFLYMWSLETGTEWIMYPLVAYHSYIISSLGVGESAICVPQLQKWIHTPFQAETMKVNKTMT